MTELPSRADVTETVLAVRERLFEATPTAQVTPAEIAGRVLAESIDAPRDDPHVSRSTMDGYAVAADDPQPLAVRRREVYPEDEQPPMEPGEAVPVATGGAIPERADAVLKREDATVTDGQLRGPVLEPGTNVYRRGSNVAAGERLFERGERLSPKDAVLLDDLDRETVSVRRRWSIGVLATGTEIHEGTRPDRDSNMLLGLARAAGHETTREGTVPDNRDRLQERLEELSDRHDVVVTSGGTSVGSRDHLSAAIADSGEVLVEGCAISPGSSTTVGRLSGTAVVGVPGRPVAAHAAAVLFVRPLLTGSRRHPTLRSTAAQDIALSPDGECLVPVELEGADRIDASPQTRTARLIGSDPAATETTFRPSVLSSMTRATRADGFVLTETPITAGEVIDVVPYTGVE